MGAELSSAPIKILWNMIRSFNTSQTQILHDIVSLHIPEGRFDLDPTYSKGNFYKDGNVLPPVYKFDKHPLDETVVYGDSKDLPLSNESVGSICYDPPFIIAGGQDSKIKARFSSYPSWESLKSDYALSLREFHRILKNKGILVVKCQNIISSGKQRQTAYFLMNTALELGFNIKDEFILLSKNKIIGHNWSRQVHAHKYHSYFLVFQKSAVAKIDYSWTE